MAALNDAKRLVVKIGSALLVDAATGALRQDWLTSLAADVAQIKARGADVDVAIDARCGVNQCVKMLHGIRFRPSGRARGPEYPAPAKFRLKAWNGGVHKKEAAEICFISAASGWKNF